MTIIARILDKDQWTSCYFCRANTRSVIRVADFENYNDNGTHLYLCEAHANELVGVLIRCTSDIQSLIK